MSFDHQVDCDVNIDDSVVLLPNKKILLSLNAQTYYRLGLIGTKSTMNRTKHALPKFRIELDFDLDTSIKRDKFYKRIRKQSEHCQSKFNLVFKCVAEHLEKNIVCDTSFSTDCFDSFSLQNVELFRCLPTTKRYRNINQYVYGVKKSDYENEKVLNDFIQWLDAQIAKADFTQTDYEISTLPLDYPRDNLIKKDLYCLQLDGFFEKFTIKNLVEKLRRKIQQTPNETSIFALIVHGFEDGPQCWYGKNNEHYKAISGENLYGISFLDQNTTLIWCRSDEFDFGIEKL